MRHFLASLLLLAAPAMAQDLVLKDRGGNELRLYDTPCVNAETLMQLGEEWRPKFHAVKILNAKGHVIWFGCWIQHEEDKAYVLLQDGAEMMFDLAAFNDPAV